jgi:hypothetical protein
VNPMKAVGSRRAAAAAATGQHQQKKYGHNSLASIGNRTREPSV